MSVNFQQSDHVDGGTQVVKLAPPSKLDQGLRIAGVVTGVALTLFGVIAVIAFSAHQLPHILQWSQSLKPLGAYSCAVLGGGVALTGVASFFVHRIRTKPTDKTIQLSTEATWGISATWDVEEHMRQEIDRYISNYNEKNPTAPLPLRTSGNEKELALKLLCRDAGYADPAKGWAVVVDGTGHGSRGDVEKAAGIREGMENLVASYQPVQSVGDQKELKKLAATFGEAKNPFTTPFFWNDWKADGGSRGRNDAAATFVQIVDVQEENRKHLVIVQYADTRVMIQKANGEVDFLDDFYKDIDLKNGGVNEGNIPTVGTRALDPGDRVILVSDGVTEFLPREMIASIIFEHDDDADLLPAFEREIRSNNHVGKDALDGKDDPDGKVREHDPSDLAKHDDLAVVVLHVGEDLQSDS